MTSQGIDPSLQALPWDLELRGLEGPTLSVTLITMATLNPGDVDGAGRTEGCEWGLVSWSETLGRMGT